jgi:AraC-like DNA-binding protein
VPIDHYHLRHSSLIVDLGIGIEHFPDYRNPDVLPTHTHDVVEMGYVLQGAGRHIIGGTSFPNAPGSLGIVHYTQHHVITTGDQPMSVINLYLDLQRFSLPDLGEELSGALYAILPMHPSLRHRRNQFVHLQFPPQGPHESALWSMLDEQSHRRSGYQEAMRSQLTLFLIACARLALEQGRRGPLPECTESEATVEQLRREFDADPAAEVTVARLAQRVGWSPSHLCRVFRRHTGMSMLTYVQRQRINAAMVRLRSSTESVLSIALGCGFNDPSFFSRTFRAIAGITPSDYRRRFIGAQSAAGHRRLGVSGRARERD